MGNLFIELTIYWFKSGTLVNYIFGMTNYHKIEIVIRNSRCFQNLHKSGAAKKFYLLWYIFQNYRSILAHKLSKQRLKCIGEIEALTCPPGQPPGQPPGHLTLLKIIVQIPPYPGQNAVQMPHTRVHSGDQMPPPRGHFTSTKMT